MAKYGIGQAITRIEDDKLLFGNGKFVDDVYETQTCHLVFLRSPYARAKIKSIDTEEAKNHKGILGIFTGQDLRASGIMPIPTNPSLKHPNGNVMSAPPNFALATEYVNYVGEPVVGIVSTDKDNALDAMEKIFVDYEELKSVISIDAATDANAPIIWKDSPNNIAASNDFGNHEECNRIFSEAHHVSRVNIDNQRLAPVCLEPRGSQASYDKNKDKIILRTSCQNPAGIHKTISQDVFNSAPEKFQVITGDVGGGFGMKTQLYPEDIVCAFASKKLSRTVLWRSTRSEDFLSGNHGRDQISDGSLALDKEGRILALKVEIKANIGAYATGPGAIIACMVGPKVITGVYDIPCISLSSTAYLTNTNVVGAYRGAGRPEAIYLIERLMDTAAFEMKIPQDEIRRKNLILPEQMPYTTAMGEKFDSGNFPKILQQAIDKSDWNNFDKRKKLSNSKKLLRGRGISTFLEWTGALPEENVTLSVEGDGRVRAYTGLQAMGQGLETCFLQIISETLSIDPKYIEIVQGDSEIGPSVGSMGSRSLYIGGSGFFTASKDILDMAKKLAGEKLECSIDDLKYSNGKFQVTGTDIDIELFELAKTQNDQKISVSKLQKVGGPSWPNSCHVCEVEIDPETGVVKLEKYLTIDDVGTVVNPLIVEGQVHGGIAQAFGQAITEGINYDESGQLLTGSLLDYCIPRADDLINFETFTDQSSPCRINPLGAKGVGELGTVGGTPTIINAILDALRPMGVKDIKMPATSEKIWAALNKVKY